MAKDKEVAVTANTTVGEHQPEWMKGAAGQGTESLSAEALSPPRLVMAQALSPQLEEMADLRPGMFFNSVENVVYGSMVRIIPCFMTEAYFLFAPRVPGGTGGLLARAVDGIHWSPPHQTFEVVVDKSGRKVKWSTNTTVAKSGLAAWGTSDPLDPNSPPAAVHAINCVVMLADHRDAGPSVLTFTRSAIKTGKKFAGNLKMSRAPSFGRVFELSSLKVEGPSGPYFEPRLKPSGFVADMALYNEAKSIYEMAKGRGVEVDMDPDTQPTGHGKVSKDTGDDEIPF